MSKHSRLNTYLRGMASEILKNKDCISRVASESVTSIKFTDGHVHHHLDGKEETTKEIIKDLISISGMNFTPEHKETAAERKPIIFKNRQAIGDILMFTCAIRDFKSAFPDWPINVQSTAMHIWDNNPYLDRSLTNANADIIEIGPGALTNASNRDDRHFANAFRLSIQEKLGIEFPQGPIKPDIWMTKEETVEPIIKPPYWIIVAGEKGDWTAKTYPFKRWEEIVAQYPGMKFVQIGAKEHKHPKLEGPNIINMIGETQGRDDGIRKLFKLFYFAEGSMGLVSFQMHLAAAFGMPCVVIAGAREPARFTRFPGHQYLCTDGCLPCAADKACWHCDLEKTCPTIIEENGQRFPRCVDIIDTYDVIKAFDQYYQGGRLFFDTPRVPTLPNLISKKITMPMVKANLTPKKDLHEFKKEEDFVDPAKWGFEWGGACITDMDWEFLRKTCDQYDVKTVMEFGPGLSSFLLTDRGMGVVSFETRDNWMESLIGKGASDKFDLHAWNGKVLNLGDDVHFDLAIVDGPPGGPSREMSTKIASERADIVLVHDAGREYEKKWQDKYLKEGFEGPVKGGHRFHAWMKKGVHEPRISPEVPIPPIAAGDDTKVFRMLFNGRGEGGAERSTTWIMNTFHEMGWRVEYVHPGPSPSGTFRKIGNHNILTTSSLTTLSHPCDVFMLYTNDWVWEFNKEGVVRALEAVQAKRKVMAINFRLGEIGKIPWTRGWDKYIFLNSSLNDAFTVQYMEASGDTFYGISPTILPPPTDLSEYESVKVDYGGSMKIVRHSSQNDAKYAKDFNDKIRAILEAFPDATIRLMPGPSFLEDHGERVIVHKKNQPQVKDFLALGNIFWYDLPEGYHDMGPKVVMEAQAAGLPVVANNHSGPKDRVVEGTGFLYNDFDKSSELFKLLNHEPTRRIMGKAAFQHAIGSYNPKSWIRTITGENDGDI